MNHIYSWEMMDVVEARGLEDELAATRRLAIAHEAAREIQRTATIALRQREAYRRAVEKEEGAQGSAAVPTLGDSFPLPTTSSRPQFNCESYPALTSHVDWNRIAPTKGANRSQQQLVDPRVAFLQKNANLTTVEIKLKGQR